MFKSIFAVAVTALVSVAGCMPVGRVPPAYLAETAPVLAPGQVAVTGALGAGGDSGGDVRGGGARVRVGIGGKQELGVEGSTLALHQQVDPSAFDDQPPTYLDSHAYAARLSWKRAMNDKLSLLAGAGAAYTSGGVDQGAYKGLSLGGDAGFVASASAINGVTPYAGGRLSFSVPMSAPTMSMTSPGDPAFASFITMSGGFAMPLFSTARLFVEGGVTSQITGQPVDTLLGYGVFALVGVGVTLGK